MAQECSRIILSESLEESLWISVRKLEERKNLLHTSAKHLHDLKQSDQEAEKLTKAKKINVHIKRFKNLLVSLGKTASKRMGTRKNRIKFYFCAGKRSMLLSPAQNCRRSSAGRATHS